MKTSVKVPTVIALSSVLLPMVLLARGADTDSLTVVSNDDVVEIDGCVYVAKTFSRKPLTGILRDFCANKQIEREANFVNDMQEGPATEWYENGQRRVEATYRKGKMRHGSQWWDESGNEKKPEKRP